VHPNADKAFWLKAVFGALDGSGMKVQDLLCFVDEDVRAQPSTN